MFGLSPLYLRLAGLAVVALVATNLWLHNRLQNAKIESLSQQVIMRDGQLAIQNDAIDEMKVAADKRLLVAEQKLKAAQAVAIGHTEKAQVIYKMKAGKDDCVAAFELGNTQ